MFCYQCQEAAKNVGCTTRGVCGKEDHTAALQDAILYAARVFAEQLEAGTTSVEPYHELLYDALFTTITNANFDDDALARRAAALIDEARNVAATQGTMDLLERRIASDLASDVESLRTLGETHGVEEIVDENIRSLRELLTYGLKGVAAYGHHALRLGYRDEETLAFMTKALAASLKDDHTIDDLLGLVMECGSVGVKVMALLDSANTGTYGNPEITEVSLDVRDNPGILISGHDLKDLEELLKQTEGTGVDVYTHSEMLPAHYYPAFKKYSHFVGNYGNAWWQQADEFARFNGPVLMTTNCIVPPRESYRDRIFTTGSAGFDGVTHIEERTDGTKDFSALIERAKKCPAPESLERGTLTGGFAHNQVMALADKVVDAVKDGAIKKFVVMAGCDGRHKSREYYTDFASQLPDDSVILTAGCAKYRYNKLQLGDIGGIPRVLDAGQCNDSYSLAVIAMKLQEVFELDDINDLPIVYNIAWYEQKAVIVLLALLSLGVKNIHLGPTLPAFLSPAVRDVLIEKFNIAGISDVETDIASML